MAGISLLRLEQIYFAPLPDLDWFSAGLYWGKGGSAQLDMGEIDG